MKVVLVAINAKYIHTNLAIRNLADYVKFHWQKEDGPCPEMVLREFTINQSFDEMLAALYHEAADVLAFSCYLWNISFVERLLAEYPKITPWMSKPLQFLLGGPEVSFHVDSLLERYRDLLPHDAASQVTILPSEGEERLLRYLRGHLRKERDAARGFGNLKFDFPTKVTHDVQEQFISLDDLPFPYLDLNALEHQILYYESSRGCPFGCSYCLSSLDRHLRFRSLSLVLEDLQCFLNANVQQVKFVDRTFNADRGRAREIWSFLTAHDNGHTNFHFEIAADLLEEADLKLFANMRPGLIQLEIGVQSTCERTLEEIDRPGSFAKLADVVGRILALGNIHIHLDLIAGLPYEDAQRFRQSFDDVYGLQPAQLQLGFLKVLRGSIMEAQAARYNLVYQNQAPYEILSNRWLSYGELLALKELESLLEVYYNSGQFAHSLRLLEQYFDGPYAMYEAFAYYYREHSFFGRALSRGSRYEALYEFALQVIAQHPEFSSSITSNQQANARTKAIFPQPGDLEKQFREALILDFYLRENAKNRPSFAGEETLSKAEMAAFYDAEATTPHYLLGYEGFDKRALRKMTHMERLGDKVYVFDYRHRDAISQSARLIALERLRTET